jgi:hypothetical protein
MLPLALATAAIVAALTACTTPQQPSPTAPSNLRSAASSGVFPAGMYGFQNVPAKRSGARVDFHAPASCGSVLDAIEAGQWTATTLVPPIAPFTSSIVELRRGDTEALAQLSTSPVSCDGSITQPVKETLELSGAESAKGTAEYLEFQCAPQGDKEKSVSFAGFYDDPGPVHVMVQLTLRGVKGTQQIDADGDTEVGVMHGGTSALDAFGTLMAAAMSADQSDDQQLEEQGAALGTGYHSGDGFSGTATLTSTSPLKGTLHLNGLVDDDGAKTLSLTAGFACG